jgi:PBSX family phage terminase large subunit
MKTLNVKLTDKTAPVFHNLIDKILDVKNSEFWIRGGRGSCKSSFAGCVVPFGMMEDYYMKNMLTHAVVLRKIGASVEGSIFNQFKWGVSHLGVSHLWKFIKSPKMATFIPSGQTIYFTGCDDPIKLKSIKSETGHIKYRVFEEFNQFDGMAEIRNINQSLVRGGESVGLFIYNPSPNKLQWTNVEAENEKEGRVYHDSTYEAIPEEWLGTQFFKDAEYLKKQNFKAYQNEYLGIVTGEGGDVFKNIKEISLTDDDILQFERIRQGLDFGFTADPTAYCKICYVKNKNSIFIFDELYEYEISTRHLCELLEDKIDPYTTIKADSAEKRTINTMNFEYLMNVTPCMKGPDSVRHGVKWLQDLDNIYIDRHRCPNTWREFSTYQYEKNKNDTFINKYPDKNNHAIDAVRYSLDDIILETGWRVG